MRIGFMRPPAFGSSNQSVPVAPACTISFALFMLRAGSRSP
jgi:hypothetical protein